MFDFTNPLKVGLLALFTGIIFGVISAWYLTSNYKDAVYGKAIEAQKKEAALLLVKSTTELLIKERLAIVKSNQLEKQNADAIQKIVNLTSLNRKLIDDLGGLRDPGRRTSSNNSEGSSTSTGGITDCTTNCKLSGEATDFLLRLTEEADKVAVYANTCHKWITGVIKDE